MIDNIIGLLISCFAFFVWLYFGNRDTLHIKLGNHFELTFDVVAAMIFALIVNYELPIINSFHWHPLLAMTTLWVSTAVLMISIIYLSIYIKFLKRH